VLDRVDASPVGPNLGKTCRTGAGAEVEHDPFSVRRPAGIVSAISSRSTGANFVA
jgi:hypothetical protein